MFNAVYFRHLCAKTLTIRKYCRRHCLDNTQSIVCGTCLESDKNLLALNLTPKKSKVKLCLKKYLVLY